jgi:hypothetical protein
VSSKKERRRRELERLQKAIERQKAEKEFEPEDGESTLEPLEQETPDEPDEPEDSDRFWDAFRAADLEGKEALFREMLASEEMDGDYAFEMLNTIRGRLDTNDPEGRARYAGLLEELRQGAPDLYRQRASTYYRNLISDAVAAKRWDDVPQFLAHFADRPARDIDIFVQVIDQLTYHGGVQALIETMTRAWPKMRDSDEMTPWGVDDFVGKLMTLHLFRYLKTTDAPRADDPELLEATAPFGQWERAWLERVVPRLAAPELSQWKMADFGPTVDADQWQENLSGLLAEFVADQYRRGVPYGRGHIAWMRLGDVLRRQVAEPARRFEAAVKGQTGRRRQGRRGMMIPAPLPLVPRQRALEEALVDLFPFLGAQPYQAAALLELVPAYLHFLARLGLIHPVQMDAALEELYPLYQRALQPIRYYGGDPRAVENVEAAWSDDVLSAIKEDPALAEARETLPEPIPRPERVSARPGAVLTYTLKVTYLRDPDVWRTIEIAAHQTLDTLHYAIQDAVDFDRDHLYSFFMSNRAWDEDGSYSSPYADGRSATDVRIADLHLRMRQRFLYLFDYGDDHRFEVQLIEVNPEAAKDRNYPRIVEVHGADPEQYW